MNAHFWSWLIVVLMFVFDIALAIIVSVDRLVVYIPTPHIMSLAFLVFGFTILVVVEQFRGDN